MTDFRIYSTSHIDNVPWHDADPPPRRHKCWAQTQAFTSDGIVKRCACGAISLGRDIWLDRNARMPAPSTDSTSPSKRSWRQRLLRTRR